MLKLFRDNGEYTERLQRLGRYLIASLESENPKFSYIGVALNKSVSLSWIKHIKLLLHKCCIYLEKLKPGRLLRSFTSNWLVFICCALSLSSYYRKSHGQHYISFIFKCDCFIYIIKYMGHSKGKIHGTIKIGNVSIVQ